jgi:hypothetical protein
MFFAAFKICIQSKKLPQVQQKNAKNWGGGLYCGGACCKFYVQAPELSIYLLWKEGVGWGVRKKQEIESHIWTKQLSSVILNF